ncbi:MULTISPECIES: methyltransferase domain-containing protein [unclassified Mesorhizobium]|uniref:class I SAM-dependent methyltransferase n=1 Tax=unclassified Mesorhizobium TaxID=325217 RepID=UPI00333DCA19
MPDVYAQITTADPAVVAVLINAMELRAADPRQKAIRHSFFSSIDFPERARVLEGGCGSGPISRELARWPGVNEVVGLDPSPIFLAKARELAADIPNLNFVEGDARSLPHEDNSFDVVIFHTCLTHVPGPEKALTESLRVLRPGGCLAIFDGDYATTTVAIGDHDPLQDCVDAAMAALVNDRWLTRRLPLLAKSAGFVVEKFDSYGYAQIAAPDYMLTLVDRGADILAGWKRLDKALGDGLKHEARRRVETGEFFGFIAFAGLIARKSA